MEANGLRASELPSFCGSLCAVFIVKTRSRAMESFHLGAPPNSTATSQPNGVDGAAALRGCNTSAIYLANEVLSVC